MHARRADVFRLVLVAGLVAGCGSDTTGPAPADPSQLYWRLDLNHHAVTLSLIPPSDTVRLVATPRTTAGAALAGGTNLRFTVPSGDTSILVSPTGFITAHAPTADQPVLVQASLTVGQVTHTDSLLVRVNDVSPPPAVGSLSIHPATGAQLTVACGVQTSGLVPTVILDRSGDTLTNVPVAYRSGDPNEVFVDSWSGKLNALCVTPNGVGRAHAVTLYATATVYGTPVTDSVRVVVVAPRVGIVRPSRSNGITTTCVPGPIFLSKDVVVSVGGVVVWMPDITYLPSSLPFKPCGSGTVDIIFDDPSAAVATTDTMSVTTPFGTALMPPSEAAGNIAPFTAAPTNFGEVFGLVYGRIRRFPRVGTYHFHSTLSGESGTVTVMDTLP